MMDDRDVARLLTVNDPLLAPLILARTEELRRHALETVLVTHAQPIVERVLSRYHHGDRLLSSEEAEDISATVVLRLVRKLLLVPFNENEAVERLADFAATLTFNAIYDFMRRRFPERTRLKNRIRYILSRDPRFRTWGGSGGTVCALTSWMPGQDAASDLPVGPFALPKRRLDPARPADAVEAILASAGKPVLLDHLLRVLADLWQISEPRANGERREVIEAHQATQLESRQYLESLWREIRELRAPQRAALLLNLRDADGGNAMALFILVGVATLEELATAMELPIERLASIWNELPLDDLTIGTMLGVSRQQVINLRKSARERLVRRMKQP